MQGLAACLLRARCTYQRELAKQIELLESARVISIRRSAGRAWLRPARQQKRKSGRDVGPLGSRASRTAALLADSRLSPIRVLQFACWSRIGTTALMVVRPTTESISSRPPICSKRSRMLANPTPHVKTSFSPTN
jgi:hypothetical protein